MKTAGMVLVSLVLAATGAHTQVSGTGPSYFADVEHYTYINTTKATQNYLGCLQSSNEGVVESALAQVAMMKLAMPESSFGNLEAKVSEIAREASTAESRYKAYLVERVLAQPEIFMGSEHGAYSDADELFGALASKLCAYCMR